MRYGGPAVGWRCADAGEKLRRVAKARLWRALQALLRGLDARGAMLTWLERGMPSAAVAASGHESGSSGAFGWLGGWKPTNKPNVQSYELVAKLRATY